MLTIREETHLVCLHCGNAYDSRPYNGFCSRLGPSLVICPQCHEATPTDRVEWRDMGWPGKAWYVFASLVYLVYMMIFGMTSGWCVMYFWFTAFDKKLGDTTATAIPGAILWGGLTLILQIIRVRSSLSRKEGEAVALPFWNLALSLQMKMQAGLFLVPIVAALLSLPVRWLVGR